MRVNAKTVQGSFPVRRKVVEVVRKDGLKLVLGDGSWVCYRLSGTEPVVRLYSEASSPAELEKLVAAGKQWIFES